MGCTVFCVHVPTHTHRGHAKRDYEVLRSINKEKDKLRKKQQHGPDV